MRIIDAFVGGVWGALLALPALYTLFRIIETAKAGGGIKALLLLGALFLILVVANVAARIYRVRKAKPSLEVRLKDAPRDANLKDWVDAVSQDTGVYREYKKYAVVLRPETEIILHFGLDLTHHGERADHVAFAIRPDTDWRLLQPLEEHRPQVTLSYRDEKGDHVRRENEIVMSGEQHLEVAVAVTLRPKLASRDDEFKAMSGLSRLALHVQIAANDEGHRLHVEYNVAALREKIAEDIERMFDRVLKHRAGRDSLLQPGEAQRFFGYFRDALCGDE